MGYYPRICDLREDHDKTQADIARCLQINQPQYSLYESGKRDIPTELVDYYRTSTDYLPGRTNTPKPMK